MIWSVENQIVGYTVSDYGKQEFKIVKLELERNFFGMVRGVYGAELD